MVEFQPENCAAADAVEAAIQPAPSGTQLHSVKPSPPSSMADLAASLRPVVEAIQAVARGQIEHGGALDRMEKTVAQHAVIPKLIADAKQALEQRNVVSRAMFDALHAELKTYKDAFVLDVVLKPVIRDLISLYDDVSEIHRQLSLALSSQEQKGPLVGSTLILFETVAAPALQLEHNREAIIEILERLDVTLMPPGSGKLDKHNQRAVTVEPAENPEEDQDIVKVVKRGFVWKERVIRPEGVIIKRWRTPAAAPARQ